MYFCFENLKQAEILFSDEMDGLLFFYENHYRKIDKKCVCVAVSGGADSLSLLFLMHTWARKNNWEIFCITVDHKLRKESLDEALYVKKICEDLKIHHEILTWNHTDIKDEGKLENLARDARYDLIKKFCEEKNIDFVATGHNWNDQMETYELRKNSGSSKIGLAGMNQIKTLSENLKLIRPILHFSKKYLEDFLIKKNVSWKIDPMNFDDNFKRVSVRKKINSYDFEKIKLISKKIINYEIQRYEIEKNSVDFLKKYCEISDFGFAKVDKKFFLHQKGEIQTEILKRLIWNIGMKKYPTKINSKILSDILNKEINTLGKCFIKIRKENIFIFREKRNLQKMNFADESPFIWDNRFLIKTKLTNNQYIYSSGNEFNLPKDVLAGFPCLYENHKVKYSLDEWIKFVSFLKKPDLFDIFCGVHSE